MKHKTCINSWNIYLHIVFYPNSDEIYIFKDHIGVNIKLLTPVILIPVDTSNITLTLL